MVVEQVITLPWCIMQILLSLTALCHVNLGDLSVFGAFLRRRCSAATLLLLLIVIDVIKGMVLGGHFDTGPHFPVRGFLAFGPIAVNTDVI